MFTRRIVKEAQEELFIECSEKMIAINEQINESFTEGQCIRYLDKKLRITDVIDSSLDYWDGIPHVIKPHLKCHYLNDKGVIKKLTISGLKNIMSLTEQNK